MRLDFTMTLSSAVLILAEPNDKKCWIMDTAYHHFSESQSRLKMSDKPATKDSGYWPNSCYCLYRSTEPVSKSVEDLTLLFNDYNFSIIQDAKDQKYEGAHADIFGSSFLSALRPYNRQYLNNLSHVTKDVYAKIWGKKYGNLNSNARVISKMLPYFVESRNAREKVPLEKVYHIF